MKRSKEELIKSYYELTKKLGKFPSVREVRKFICSGDTIKKYFKSMSGFKEAVLEKYQELADFIVIAELKLEDVEAYRLGLHNNQVKKKNKNFVASVSTLEYIAEFAKNTFNGRVKPYRIPKSKRSIKRALVLTLSDLHFGSDVKAAETGYQDFGTVQEARRFARIIKEVIDYKTQYRDNTELHVNLLGDIIQNKLHDVQDAAALAEQAARAMHLLIQGLALLAENFPRVTVHCSSGNHGRLTSRHKDRASSGKWDSIETIIYYACKEALDKYQNLLFDLPKTPYLLYNCLNNKFFATHGDNVLNPGNPGSSINVKSLENQLNRINATLPNAEEIKVAIVGHVHTASVTLLSNGVSMITNGCLPPVDQYAVSLGILENVPVQVLFEATEGFPLGDVRFIQAGIKDDKNEQLDDLIEPWKEF